MPPGFPYRLSVLVDKLTYRFRYPRPGDMMGFAFTSQPSAIGIVVILWDGTKDRTDYVRQRGPRRLVTVHYVVILSRGSPGNPMA
ncbi:MAG TPA: hypothetical protein VE196_11540 [Pseudonocardiaceae bacterium]|jgi:hypothetical protein|nr:hypothetical protein [Pseudonocardiaceae bacterium]